MIEAYGVEGAIKLGQRLNVDEVELLLKQTYNLRRDPKELEKENAEKALQEWIDKNKGEVLLVEGSKGEKIEIDLSMYAMN